MARKVEVRYTDDLDDGPAAETVSFSLDRTGYEIDLSAKNAKELRTVLDRFIQHGRRQPKTATRTTRARSNDGTNAAVRAWAQSRGLDVAERGRLPQAIVEQYQQAAANPMPTAEAKPPARRRRSN
jgi:hypothetical protein